VKASESLAIDTNESVNINKAIGTDAKLYIGAKDIKVNANVDSKRDVTFVAKDGDLNINKDVTSKEGSIAGIAEKGDINVKNAKLTATEGLGVKGRNVTVRRVFYHSLEITARLISPV